MKRTVIANLKVGETQKVCGFVDTIRRMKRNQFVIVRDHTGKVQLYIDTKHSPELSAKVNALSAESTIEVIGTVLENKSVKIGGIEMLPNEINIISQAKVGLPISHDSSLDVRLDWRFLDLRDPNNLLIFKIQTVIEHAMREFWTQNDFIEIHSPKLMGTASESGSELFSLDYFGHKAYLAQSPQFYKQMAMNAGFDRVFEIGPVFRANPSFTSRHDTEFTCVDAEISWIESHEDVMHFEEMWIHYFMTQLKEKLGDEIFEKFGVPVTIPTIPFPRIELLEAKRLIKEQGYSSPKTEDLDPEDEKILCSYFQKKFNHDFVFVTNYPVSVRPFYHMRHADNPKLTKSYDLLYRGLEVTTGAQREHRYDILKSQILEKQVSENDSKLLESLKYYLQFFEYGSVPHGGYGFGLTRMIMKLLNLQNVRQVTYLYRGPKRLTP